MAPISYRRHRFPPVVIQHAVWLYLRFTLSYRDVEELLCRAWPRSLLRKRSQLGAQSPPTSFSPEPISAAPGSGSHVTRRWREMDSNYRSPCVWAGDSGRRVLAAIAVFKLAGTVPTRELINARPRGGLR
jgi:hypothetical protein